MIEDPDPLEDDIDLRLVSEEAELPDAPAIAGEGEVVCPICDGTGRLDEDTPCPECDGRGIVVERIAGD